MNLSDVKFFDSGAHEYDVAHGELGREEQINPCTCQIRARERSGGALYPSLIERVDADPDCELHFPWMREDGVERRGGMRTWMAGYQVGFATASPSVLDPRVEGLVADYIETLDLMGGREEEIAGVEATLAELRSGV